MADESNITTNMDHQGHKGTPRNANSQHVENRCVVVQRPVEPVMM
jgi:hypothetical protein